MKLIHNIVLILSIVSMAKSQPPTEWMRTYHQGGARQETFYDIYKVSNGGYVACGYSDGQTWIIRLNNEGNAAWSELYDGNSAQSIIETDEGNFITGRTVDGEEGQDQISALVVDPDGEVVWENSYGLGGCNAVIELKDGAFLLAGGRSSQGLIVMIENDGDLLWQNVYPEQANYFRGMRETAGGVVLSGYIRVAPSDYRFCATK